MTRCVPVSRVSGRAKGKCGSNTRPYFTAKAHKACPIVTDDSAAGAGRVEQSETRRDQLDLGDQGGRKPTVKQ
jgi:hypothetical protein